MVAPPWLRALLAAWACQVPAEGRPGGRAAAARAGGDLVANASVVYPRDRRVAQGIARRRRRRSDAVATQQVPHSRRGADGGAGRPAQPRPVRAAEPPSPDVAPSTERLTRAQSDQRRRDLGPGAVAAVARELGKTATAERGQQWRRGEMLIGGERPPAAVLDDLVRAAHVPAAVVRDSPDGNATAELSGGTGAAGGPRKGWSTSGEGPQSESSRSFPFGIGRRYTQAKRDVAAFIQSRSHMEVTALLLLGVVSIGGSGVCLLAFCLLTDEAIEDQLDESEQKHAAEKTPLLRHHEESARKPLRTPPPLGPLSGHRVDSQPRAASHPSPSMASLPSVPPKDEHLCPSLVVPEGMEFVFVVPELVRRGRQQLSFIIRDLQGNDLSHAVVSETTQASSQCSIFLLTLKDELLAVVNTESAHVASGEQLSLPICRPSGEVFCAVMRDGPASAGQYVVQDGSGHPMLTFHGDFREKAINVVNSVGRLVGATERTVVDFDRDPHYQVRVAPHVDAGLVTCSLLAIDKIEGSAPFTLGVSDM